MNSAMKLSEAAIRAITTIKFYENYLDKHGRLSWDSYKDNLEKAVSVFFVVSICVHLCKWTRVSVSIPMDRFLDQNACSWINPQSSGD